MLYFGHPKNGLPRFALVFEYLKLASTSQKHKGDAKVRLPTDEENSDDDDNILT